MSQEAENADLYKRAQRALVAALVYDGDHASQAFEIISPDDIREADLSVIVDAIMELVREDINITQISIAEQLERSGNLKAAGGFGTLNELHHEGRQRLIDHDIELYAGIVLQQSAKHNLRELLDESKNAFADDSGTQASDAISELQSQLNEQLYRLSDDSTVVEIGDTVDEYFQLLEERREITEQNAKDASGLQGIPSMLPTINKVTTGWLPGQMITIGARTGVGKSVFAVNSAVAACQAGKSVLFFSLEMSATEIQDRVFSSISGVPMNNAKLGTLAPDETQKLEAAAQDVAKMKLQVETEPKITIDAIRAKALKRLQSEEGLDLIIVDYLQLITPSSSRYGSRQEAVADLSRNIKLMAKQLAVPIIVLVQLNRESGEEEDSMPAIHHIRESGAIGQDSDIVILLHRDKGYDGEIPDTLIKIEKHRNGEAGHIIRCHSHLDKSAFIEKKKSQDIDHTDDDLSELEDLGSYDDDLDGIIEPYDEFAGL